MDSEKVIERLQRVSHYFKSMLKVGYDGDAEIYREHRESVKMAIALLKEQEATIEILVKDITFHNCNNCNRKYCKSKPNAGQPVRSNCIHWLEGR